MDDFDARRESDWQQRTEILPPDKIKEFDKYPMVTADTLKTRRERPKRVKMLARDFIEGDLYPPIISRWALTGGDRQPLQSPLRVLS